MLIRNYPIIPRKLPACSVVFPFSLPSHCCGECVLIQVKGKLPRGHHCSPDPFQEVHFYTRPCSHPHFSSSLICHRFTELVFKEVSRVSCYYGSTMKHRLIFGTLAQLMVLFLEAVKSSGDGAQLIGVDHWASNVRPGL